LTEIKNFFVSVKPLADIRAEGKRLKDKYVSPMDGIDLDGATLATKATLANSTKSTTSIAEMANAKDHDRSFTTSLGTQKTLLYKSGKDR